MTTVESNAAPHRRAFDPTATGPLDELVVLDLTRLVAGNMLTLQLADFGAEVVKVEPPKSGDPLRDWRTAGVSAHWKVYARNKKSMTLNLRHDVAREALLKLVEQADVLVENYRPGTIETLGLGPDVLHARNSRLVLVRISGWGQDGPYAQRPGFGTLVEAASGFAARNGFADREPVLPPLALADMIAGLSGAFAVMAALRHRDKTGRGQVIDLPLLDPIVSILGPEAALFKLTGRNKERVGSRTVTASPRNVFRTQDNRWLSISATTQAMAQRLYVAIGRGDMIEDPRFATNSARVGNIEAAEEPIRAFIAERSLDDCMAFFERHEVTAAPVYDIDQLVSDPHVCAREILFEVPDEDMGYVPMHAVTPRLSASPGSVRHRAPNLGEHTEEMLLRVGIDAAAVAVMRDEGAV